MKLLYLLFLISWLSCCLRLSSQGINPIDYNLINGPSLSLAAEVLNVFPIDINIQYQNRINGDDEDWLIYGHGLLESTGRFTAVIRQKTKKTFNSKKRLVFNFQDEQNEVIYQIEDTIVSDLGEKFKPIDHNLPIGVTFLTRSIQVSITDFSTSPKVDIEEVARKTELAIRYVKTKLRRESVSEQALLETLKFQNTILAPEDLEICTRIEEVSPQLFMGLYLDDTKSILDNALKKCQYDEIRYFHFPYGNGIAIVTTMEQINEDGTSKSGALGWNEYFMDIESFSLKAFFRTLLFGTEGYFRFFIFLITNQNMQNAYTDDYLDTNDIQKLFNKGGKWINMEDFRDTKFDKGYHCVARIYEYQKTNIDEKPILLRESIFKTGEPIHLEKSEILKFIKTQIEKPNCVAYEEIIIRTKFSMHKNPKLNIYISAFFLGVMALAYLILSIQSIIGKFGHYTSAVWIWLLILSLPIFFLLFLENSNTKRINFSDITATWILFLMVAYVCMVILIVIGEPILRIAWNQTSQGVYYRSFQFLLPIGLFLLLLLYLLKNHQHSMSKIEKETNFLTLQRIEFDSHQKNTFKEKIANGEIEEVIHLIKQNIRDKPQFQEQFNLLTLLMQQWKSTQRSKGLLISYQEGSIQELRISNCLLSVIN